VLSETAGETFVCPEIGGNGNYADPATCRRFYQVFFINIIYIITFLLFNKLNNNF
jgi:hypothetical protein